ncbi:MAG: S-adenosylmethionine decarboxylase [Candidatus Nanoarchaeia archaeon]
MFWGKLASINLYDCNSELIKNKGKINNYIIKLCNIIKVKRFGLATIKRFAEGNLKGYSAMQFIETSSITLHFDETENRAFIDIFSCKDFKEKDAEKFSKNFFKAKRSKCKVLIRD